MSRPRFAIFPRLLPFTIIVWAIIVAGCLNRQIHIGDTKNIESVKEIDWSYHSKGCYSIPDGIVDQQYQTAYIGNEKGGIDAIRIANGKLLWTTKEKYRPLWVGKKLLAQESLKEHSSKVRLVLLDLEDAGKITWHSDWFELPSRCPTDKSETNGFEARAWRDVKGNFVYQWRALVDNCGGGVQRVVYPPPTFFSGCALVRRDDGSVVVNPKDAPKQSKATEWFLKTPKMDADLYFDGMVWREDAIVDGDFLLRIESRNGLPKIETIVSVTATDPKTKKMLWSETLSCGKCDDIYYPPDSRFIYMRNKTTWTVFDYLTKQTIASFDLPATGDRPIVVGGYLFWVDKGVNRGDLVIPRYLHCKRLGSRRVLWRKRVRDETHYSMLVP